MISEFSGDFLQWLRGFYFTARLGSVAEAAGAMHRTQSSVTSMLRSLEEELGVKLFAGKKGSRELSPEGQALFEQALKIFALVEEIREEIGSAGPDGRGTISIGAFYTLMEYYLPEHVRAFSLKYPEVRFAMDGFVLPDQLFSKLYTREYDLGFMPAGDAPSDLEVTPLFSCDTLLLSPLEGPLAITALPDIEALAGYPVLTHPSGGTLEPFIEKQFASLGLSAPGTHMIGHYNAIKQYVSMGMGVAIVDGFICTPEDRSRFNVLSMGNYFQPRSYCMICNPAMHHPGYTAAFIEHMKEAARDAE